MTLQEIVDAWRSQGEIDDADRADTSLVCLRNKYPQTTSNIDFDTLITTTQRTNLLRQLIGVDVDDEGLICGALKRFCGGNEYLGEEQPTAAKATLGHVEELDSFQKALTSATAHFLPMTRRQRAGISVRQQLKNRNVNDQKLILQNCPLRRYKTWSCYQSHRLTEPFYGVASTRDAVRNVLGLGMMADDKPIVRWGHKLRDGQKAYRPTAFDAEAYEWFRPGGKTAPLNGIGEGLREVVHGAIYADQLEQLIEILD